MVTVPRACVVYTAQQAPVSITVRIQGFHLCRCFSNCCYFAYSCGCCRRLGRDGLRRR